MSIFSQVEDFNRKVVGVPVRELDQIQDPEEVGFLVGTLHEEIEEFEEALNQDFIAQIDALIDLIYFAAGGLTRMGVPAELSEKIFTAVHYSNMTKKRGMKAERSATHELDAVKPVDWVSPEETIIALIEQHMATQAAVNG